MLKKVLLIEDNIADASLLKELILEESADINIHWVKDGREAIDYIKSEDPFGSYINKPEFIILDLGLPKISGYEVLKELKKSHCKETPVIVLSTSSNPLDLTECSNLGASNYYSKPNDLKGYLALANKLVNVEMPKMSLSVA